MRMKIYEEKAAEVGLTVEQWLSNQLKKPGTLRYHARRLGIDDQALRKLRRKFNIPMPPSRGLHPMSAIAQMAAQEGKQPKEFLAEWLQVEGNLQALADALGVSRRALWVARKALGFPAEFGNSGSRLDKARALTDSQVREVMKEDE